MLNLLESLKPKIERPFSDKLLETQGLIARNIHQFGDKCAVAFSGGKDSEVALWLTLQVKPDVLVVFNNTGVEYPETVKFVHELKEKWKLNLIETRPVKTFWECVKEHGFATAKAGIKRAGTSCCYHCKEKPMAIVVKEKSLQAMFTGTTATENRNWMFHADKDGACYYSKTWGLQRVHPILWWTEQEVRGFIHDQRLPMNPIYSKGCDRVGCMPCTAFKTWEAQLSQTNPKFYRLLKLRKDKQYVMDIRSPALPLDSESKKP